MWAVLFSQNCFMSSSLLSPMIQVKKQVASGFLLTPGASLVAQRLKPLPPMQETQVWSLGQEDPLEKEIAASVFLPGVKCHFLPSYGLERGKESMGVSPHLVKTYLNWTQKEHPSTAVGFSKHVQTWEPVSRPGVLFIIFKVFQSLFCWSLKVAEIIKWSDTVGKATLVLCSSIFYSLCL